MNKIIMPEAGQTTDTFTIVHWHKTTGDSVKRGDPLFDIETDKSTLTVESYCEGILLAILYAEGAEARAGEPVAYVGKEGEEISEVKN